MTGVLATVRLMFTALSLQRWLMGACLLLALLGAAGMIAVAPASPGGWAPFAIILSPMLLVISPCFLGGPLLRSLAASRAIRLMPHGRLQLFLGSLLTQILIAAIAAATIAALIVHAQLHERLRPALILCNGATAVVFVLGFGMTSLLFITLYYASRHQLGFLGLLTCAMLIKEISLVFPHWPAHEFLASTRGLFLVFAGTSSLWALFTIAYLRAGRIAPPLSEGSGSLRWPGMQRLTARVGDASIAEAGRKAMRLQLTGSTFGRSDPRSLLGIASGVLCAFVVWNSRSNPELQAGDERFLAIVNAYVGIIAAAAAIQPLLGRARYLWLKTRLDRGQLFQAVEAESWRTLLSIGGFALAISALLCFLAKVPWVRAVEIFLLSFASGAAMIYAILRSTRGLRLVDASLTAALAALWFVGLMLSMFGSDGRRLLFLLAAELLLVPLLRAGARSRWIRIDWMVSRPARMARQTTGAPAR